MALNPEDLRGFELLDEPEDPPPPATLLVQSDRKVENKYNKQDLVGNEVQRPQKISNTHYSYLSPPGTIMLLHSEIDSGRMTTGMIFQAHADIIRFAEVAPQHQMPAYLFANGIEIGDHLSSLGRSTVVVPTHRNRE